MHRLLSRRHDSSCTGISFSYVQTIPMKQIICLLACVILPSSHGTMARPRESQCRHRVANMSQSFALFSPIQMAIRQGVRVATEWPVRLKCKSTKNPTLSLVINTTLEGGTSRLGFSTVAVRHRRPFTSIRFRWCCVWQLGWFLCLLFVNHTSTFLAVHFLTADQHMI